MSLDLGRKDSHSLALKESNVLVNVESALAHERQPFVENPELEKKLLRKIDIRLIPAAMVMYLLNYLDRNNVGNARTAGMAEDLHLSSSDFSLAVSIFFVGYILLQIPSNYILSKTKPQLYLPGLMFVWGCLVVGYVGVKNKQGLLAMRICLGIVESGFFPGVLLYMSIWYKKMELARRFSVFYTASLLAGAFGGLLAGAILSGLDGVRGLPAWKWLFLIEGVITAGVAIITVFILPDFPANTKWLSEEERDYAVARLIADHQADAVQQDALSFPRALFMGAKDIRTWMFALGHSAATCAGTVTYFIPTLVTSMGYSGREAQFMTVPIYAVSVVVTLSVCFHSDLRQERSKHIMFISAVSVVTLIITAAVPAHEHVVRYVFLAFGAASIWACTPMNLSFLSNSIDGPREKRAVCIGIVNVLSNLASVYGAYIWPTKSAPAYIPGFAACAGVQFIVFCFAASTWYFFPRWDAQRLQERQEEEVRS